MLRIALSSTIIRQVKGQSSDQEDTFDPRARPRHRIERLDKDYILVSTLAIKILHTVWTVLQLLIASIRYDSVVLALPAREKLDKSPENMSFAHCTGTTKRVLALPELVTNIFLLSDIRTVLICTMVCRLWRDIVKESPRMQVHLFFVPRLEEEAWNDVEINPALPRTIFGDLSVSVTEQTITLDRVYEEPVSTLAQWHVLDVKFKPPPRPKGNGEAEIEVQCQLGHPTASWRRMLICRPVLREARQERRINEKPKYDSIPADSVHQATGWMGTDVGPWSFGDFLVMAPYLHAGYVAIHGAAITRHHQHPLALMRLSWGPNHGPDDDKPSAAIENALMTYPCGRAIHMIPFDLGCHGMKLRTRYPHDPVLCRVGFGANEEGCHHYLDLLHNQVYLLFYERDVNLARGHFFHIQPECSWTPAPHLDAEVSTTLVDRLEKNARKTDGGRAENK